MFTFLCGMEQVKSSLLLRLNMEHGQTAASLWSRGRLFFIFFFPRRTSAYTLLTFASVCASSVTELHKLLLKLHGEFRTNILRLFLRRIFPHGEKPDGTFLNGLDSSRTSICPMKKCLKSEAKLWVGDGVGLMSDIWAGLFAAASSAAGINSLRLLECCVYIRGQLGMKSPSSWQLLCEKETPIFYI